MHTATLTSRLRELGFEATSSADIPRVAPPSAQAAADLLGACTREGWRVRLAGSGSRTAPGASPDLVISTEALAGLDVYVPEDLTAGVLAGTTHRQLEQVLVQHRQVLTLDPPVLDSASMGGTFAAAAAGPLRAAYGTPRDLALGVHAVTADGRFLRLGGQVVKNVAGYDLVRLLVGSRGTLALITQVHVRLRSVPADDRTVIATARDAAEAAALALEFRDVLHPVALEVVAPRGAQPWRLAVRFQGSAAAAEAAAAHIRRAAPESTALPDAAAAGFWNELSLAEASAGTRIRIAGRPADLGGLLEAASRIVNSASDNKSDEWLRVAHGADGIVRLCHPARTPAAAARLEPVLRSVAADLASGHGTCICEAGPDSLRAAAPRSAPAAAVARLESELRRRFDPAGILVGE